MAAVSVVNSEKYFMKLNVHIATASGWLQRLVRPQARQANSIIVVEAIARVLRIVRLLGMSATQA